MYKKLEDQKMTQSAAPRDGQSKKDDQSKTECSCLCEEIQKKTLHRPKRGKAASKASVYYDISG